MAPRENWKIVIKLGKRSCAGCRHNMPRPCDLDFWPWKWCQNHIWCGLALCQF